MANDSVKIKIDGDDSGFQKSWSNVTGSVKKGVGVAVKGIAGIGAAFTGATAMALNFAGELEQNLGGSEAVFKGYAASIQATADEAFKNMGLSASDFLANANKMGALFQGAGFSIQASADLSTQAMQRAADVASIMGIDVSMAMESIAGAAKGNFTMMDNLGVAMNATTIEAYALSKGITTSYAAMSNQQKIGLAMEMFLEKTAYAAGNYAKENETLAGALTTAKAALKNFMSGAGDVDDVVDALSNATEVILKNIKDLLPVLVEGLEGVVTQLVPMIPDILRELIPAVLSVVDELIDALIEVAPDIVAAIADGIGEAVPLLKPLADIVKVLAEHFNTLAVAVTAGFVAFKGYAVVTAVSKAIKGAQAAVSAYNIAVVANTIAVSKGMTANLLNIPTLTSSQVAYGVLTGQINLTTAATWALKAAKDALSGGIGILIGLIAAAGVALFAWAKNQDKTSKEICNSLADIRKAHEDAVKSIEDNMTAEIAEAETAMSLKDELYRLENQLKNGTATQEEAKTTQEEFNAVAGELEKMIPGITDHLYDETGAINVQKTAVDNLANSYYDLAVAKAEAEAYYEMLKDVNKSLIEAKDVEKTAKHNYIQKNLEIIEGSYGATADNIIPGSTEDKAIKGSNEALDLARAEHTVSELEKKKKGYLDGLRSAQRAVSKISGDTADKIKDDADDTGKNIATTTKKTGDKVKEQFDKELKDLEYLRDTEQITEAEYYNELEKLRDTYFEKESEDWRELNVEIHKGRKELNEKLQKENEKAFNEYKKILDKQKDAALDSMDEVLDARDDLANRFKDELVLYTEFTVPNINGEGTVTGIKFADLKKQSEDLKAYAESLNKLKGKADIPQEFFAQLRDMDTAEGKKVTDALLAMSDDDLKEYLGSWQEYQDTAEDVSNSLLSDEFTELANEIAQKFGKVPEEFFDIGVDSAKEYGEGFMQQLETELKGVREKIAAEWTSMSSGIVLSIAGAGGGTTINNNTNVTVNSNGNGDETAQTRAWNDAMKVTQLKNG